MRMGRGLRTAVLVLAPFLTCVGASAQALTVLDVPFISQSELLCGGAAAAMVMRYWGERSIDAEAFSPLVERRAGGIRTAALVDDLQARHWNAVAIQGSASRIDAELQAGRPVIALIEERRATYHFVVIVGRNDSGVIFHDPARAPFRVASAAEFDRRWSATNRWMLTVTPPDGVGGYFSRTPDEAVVDRPRTMTSDSASSCDERIADAVREAGDNDLAGAERTLVSALSCPGSAALRELAGVRVRQQRWPEAADLAAAAVNRDPSDTYAWKLLATARFIDDDRGGALDAWNEAREPKMDLLRLDGLRRTRFGVAQHLTGIKTGETLTRERLLRALRQLNELPSSIATALDYEPKSSGLVELRGVVAERPLVPSSTGDFAALGLGAAVMREIVTAVSSPTGGGEQIGVDWRFWAHRPLYRLSFAAPAPWSGVWSLSASREEQPFTQQLAKSVHDEVRLDAAAWSTGNVRWQLSGGADRWNSGATYAMTGGALRFASRANRLDLRGAAREWFGGGSSFHSGDVQLLARTSARPEGVVLVIDGGVSAISAGAPPDLWFAADTGRARPLLLRAHPILTADEQFRSDRLARLLGHDTTEVQRWWHAGPLRVGGAAFVDSARAAWRLTGRAITDVDTGVGFRVAFPGKPDAFRIDVARGLRDGATAVSAVYTANLSR